MEALEGTSIFNPGVDDHRRGARERDAKFVGSEMLIKLGKTFNGPSSIGIISAGACRLGVIGGAFDNLVALQSSIVRAPLASSRNQAASPTKLSGFARNSRMALRPRSASAETPIPALIM